TGNGGAMLVCLFQKMGAEPAKIVKIGILKVLTFPNQNAVNSSILFFRRPLGKKFSSSVGAKGMGVSRLATRITGASRYLKQCSFIQALISAPMPPVKVSS